jgi:hypothetical protein
MLKRVVKSVMPAGLWRRLATMKRLAVQRGLEAVGYCVTVSDDYYSPISPISNLRATRDRWYRPSDLTGVKYDLQQMERDLSRLIGTYYDEFAAIPPYERLQSVGFGPGYTAVDALTLYMMVRDVKPRRYIEIGSGLSTYYCSLAAARNAAEGGPQTEIICIEPHPFEKLYSIQRTRIIASRVQDVDLTLFSGLKDGDFLFIDSSHVLKIDGDVPFLYLEVLPRVNVGVIVHVHDIPFPYNIPYPPELWIFGQEWPKWWNEAMVLQAFLCFNHAFRITMSTPLIRYFDEAFLRRRVPIYQPLNENPNAFSSIWLRRVA